MPHFFKTILVSLLVFVVLTGCSSSKKDDVVLDGTINDEIFVNSEEKTNNEEIKEVIKEDNKKEISEEVLKTYDYWVVFYDQYDNELQREALKYGTTPSYKADYPEGFIKWINKKTEQDVNNFYPITGNTYFKAVCAEVHHDDKHEEPAPVNHEYLCYVRDVSPEGKYDYFDDEVLTQPVSFIEMYQYDEATDTYKYLYTGQSDEWPTTVGQWHYWEDLTDVFDENIDITGQQLANDFCELYVSWYDPSYNVPDTCQFRVFVTPHTHSNLGVTAQSVDPYTEITANVSQYNNDGYLVTFNFNGATPNEGDIFGRIISGDGTATCDIYYSSNN